MVATRAGLRFRGRRFACRLGRGGIAAACAKREGDGCTPRGIHRIVGLLWRPDRLARPAPWARPIGPADLWSDDPSDPDYNLPVRAPHPFGAERLRRADRQYDLVLLTDWNWPYPVKGRGSAIFVHRWRGPGRPTAGCVALSPEALRWIAPRLSVRSHLVVR
jgi:L,D-peptidoglycan transpeptidase YkuD (ErfK/YbiS/YcfS/YnhG family)